MIQAFELGAIGGERPPAVGRHPRDQPSSGDVEPDRHAVGVDRGAVLRHRRTCRRRSRRPRAAAAAARAAPARSTARKYGSPWLREDVGDRLALALLDQLVDVHGSPAEPPGQRARDGGLAGGHEADQIHLVGRSRDRAGSERLEEAGIGDGDGVGAFDGATGRSRRQRGDRERHRHAVIAVRVGATAAGRARRRRATTKPSGRSSASMPSARKPATSAAMRSLSLTRSSPAPRTRHLAAMRRQRRDRRQLVDQPGHLLGRDRRSCPSDRPRRRCVPRGSPASVAGHLDVDARAEAPQDADERRSASGSGRRPRSRPRAGQRRRGDHPEGRGREVAGHRRALPLPAAGRRSTETVSPSTSTVAAEGRQRPLGVVARLRPAR